jgi:hypothetical protein
MQSVFSAAARRRNALEGIAEMQITLLKGCHAKENAMLSQLITGMCQTIW